MALSYGFFMLMVIVVCSLLVFAYKKLKIKEDPRIDILEGLLPGANCGACGYPGCHQFANALLAKQSQPGECTVSDQSEKEKIAQFLGVSCINIEKSIARLACAGGDNVANWASQYQGIKRCNDASIVSGGGKACSWGCLGMGDCESACQFNAISMNQQGLPVVNESLCTACGDCVTICPKDLFSLHKKSHKLWVNCKNQQQGDNILNHCKVACTACGKCALDAENNSIKMENNLPAIDYTKTQVSNIAIQRCPTGAIVWINENGEFETGLKTNKNYPSSHFSQGLRDYRAES